jgi:subtilisin family serine protease
MWLAGTLLALLWTAPAIADNRFIVRSTLGSNALGQFCLLQSCSVIGALDGSLNQVFLLTTPSTINPTTFLNLLLITPGIVDAELDQVISLVGGLNVVTTPPAALTDNAPFSFCGQTVWNGYANQPAAQIIHVQTAQNSCQTLGSGIVADIDTGVDPNHPALKSVLLPGYDFTRNQAGGSELTDFTSPPPPPCPNCQPAIVNQSSAAILDQSSAAILDGNVQYAAFGHGTMVMGVIHLVAPKVQLLPLKAFHSDGTGFLSDILRAIYYGVQNNANIINMSFDFKTSSQELTNALDYADKLNVICVASAGNDGTQAPPNFVYPAALQNDVMGVASTSDLDTRSTFSNYGNPIVWVAAPGEAIVTTYPFSTYAAGWGTSFSAPFVTGGAALLRSLRTDLNESLAASALAHAQFVGANMGNGRLDLVMALGALQPGNSSPDFSVSVAPSGTTIAAGESASFTVSVAPSGGFNQTVTWSCTGRETVTCTVSPPAVTLDGSNAATATVTITTTARASFIPLVLPRSALPSQPLWVLAACLACSLVGMMLWKLGRFSCRREWLTTTALLVFATLCASCGTVTSPGPPPTHGTPPGTYMITITGNSNNLSHEATFRLMVK